jgi:2'-5' RNA ligase
MEHIRAFIAIELPDEVKRTLAELQAQLKSKSRAPVRWTDPTGTHLTLKFLGSIDPDLVNNILTAMKTAAHGTGPLHLEIDGPGVFPNQKRVRVIWVGLAGDLVKLDALQKRVEAAVNPLGFTTEARAFTPHLTLGRVREEARPDERENLGELIAATRNNATAVFDATNVHLIRSHLRPRGAIYTSIGSVELG